MRKISALLILFITVFYSCNTDSDNDLKVPSNISPPNDAIFYSHEQFIINWDLADENNNTEIQVLLSSTPIVNNDTGAFNNVPIGGHGGQTTHIFSIGDEDFEPILETIYVGYRLRSKDPLSNSVHSGWSAIRNFTIIPLSSLNKQTIDVYYDFDFLTEEINHEYYSGIIEKSNYRLADIAQENNLELSSIKAIRPYDGEVSFFTLLEDNRNPFGLVTFGYDEDPETNDSVYPFKPTGQIYSGSKEESPIQAQFFNKKHINLLTNLMSNNFKFTYLLVDDPNTQHELQFHFVFDVYSD